MQEAAATTASPDSDSRLRLPTMRFLARRAVWRLASRIALAWLSSGCEAVFTCVIFARFGELGARHRLPGERADQALGRIGERLQRCGEAIVRATQRVPRDGEEHFAAGEQRPDRYRVAVIEEMPPRHELRHKQALCPAVMLARCR